MKHLNQYSIPFAGLKIGHHQFEFEGDEKFFACFEHSEIETGNFSVKASLEKQSVMMILDLEINSNINVSCDRCGEPFDLSYSANERFYIKFGTEKEDADEIIVLEPQEHQILLGEKIFEMIILNLPSKRTHEEGKCNPDVLKKLEKYKPTEQEKKNDPRWDMLKNIKFN